MKLEASNIAESILDVERIEGMDIDRNLSAHQSGISLTILVGSIAVSFVGKTSQEDVVVNPIAEEGRLKVHEVGSVVHSQVNLRALFRLESSVAQLVLDAAFMHAIR